MGKTESSGGVTVVSQNGVPEGFVAVQVKTGIVSEDYVEILSGLKQGDVVYVDPNSRTTTMNMFQMGMPGGMPSGMGGGMPSGMGGNRSGSAGNRMPSGMGGRP